MKVANSSSKLDKEASQETVTIQYPVPHDDGYNVQIPETNDVFLATLNVNLTKVNSIYNPILDTTIYVSLFSLKSNVMRKVSLICILLPRTLIIFASLN